MALNHYFRIEQNGASGLLLAKGPVADVGGMIKDLDKKGITVEEISPEDAEKLKAQLEG